MSLKKLELKKFFYRMQSFNNHTCASFTFNNCKNYIGIDSFIFGPFIFHKCKILRLHNSNLVVVKAIN